MTGAFVGRRRRTFSTPSFSRLCRGHFLHAWFLWGRFWFFVFLKIKNFFLAQIRQGATPEGLALTCAIGVLFSLFPVLGVTTLFCLVAGHFLRLNQVVLQAVNYAMAPVQLILIPIFLKLGAWIFRVPAVSVNPITMAEDFMAAPMLFVEEYGIAWLQGIAAWALFTPFVAIVVYYITRSALLSYKRLRT